MKIHFKTHIILYLCYFLSNINWTCVTFRVKVDFPIIIISFITKLKKL